MPPTSHNTPSPDPSKEWKPLDYVGVALMGLVIAAFLLAWVPGWPAILCVLKKEPAAWAQAIVGTIAIIAGAWAIFWQVGQQRAQAKLDEVRRLQLLSGAILQCQATSARLREYNSEYLLPIDRQFQQLRAEIETLERVALFDMPDIGAAMAVATVVASFRENAAKIGQPVKWDQTQQPDEREKHLNALDSNLESAQEILQGCLAIRGNRLNMSIRLSETIVVSTPSAPPGR